MAFRFRSRTNATNTPTKTSPGDENKMVAPKLSSAQLNQLAKLYPPWLKDNTAVKQLPGVYQGVLGQVQLQPGIDEIERKLIGKQEKPTDYMNKFTDTERVHQLLSASQLPNETLATIWAHVNKTFPGKLTNREVCLALALIAIFQRLNKDISNGGSHFSPQNRDKDPFNLVKVEKKPPLPTLYSARGRNSNNNTSDIDNPIKGIVQSKSSPENLSLTKGLLVDIFSGNEDETQRQDSTDKMVSKPRGCNNDESNLHSSIKDLILNNAMSLMDINSDRFEIDFNKTTNIWYRFLHSMRGLFKRSFDILNVENSRQSAIEALRSPRGIDFGRNLSLCYPLAHNIKQKIDQLNSIQIATNEQSNAKPTTTIIGIFDKRYALQMDDLMTSINEYWAVLINLLHESGLTEFIELIMDGLIQFKGNNASVSIDRIALEFSSRSDLCCICHSRDYLKPDDDFLSRQHPGKVLDLIADESLISEDEQHFYHPRCASFWLNQVDTTGLPFSSELKDQEILSPALIGSF